MANQETLLKNKMKPFIAKKIVEYMDEEDQVLIDYVIRLLSEQTPAAKMVEELSAVRHVKIYEIAIG
jgi:hypothetical protein